MLAHQHSAEPIPQLDVLPQISQVGEILNTWECLGFRWRSILGEVRLDEKYRVALDRKTREVAGIRKGERLVAIPFKGGLILVAAGGRRFTGSLAGFNFVEERHEASRYLFRRKA